MKTVWQLYLFVRRWTNLRLGELCLINAALKAYSHQAKANKIKKQDQRISGKHQRKFSLSLSLSLRVNRPLEREEKTKQTQKPNACKPNPDNTLTMAFTIIWLKSRSHPRKAKAKFFFEVCHLFFDLFFLLFIDLFLLLLPLRLCVNMPLRMIFDLQAF